jgi:hypothetical protein
MAEVLLGSAPFVPMMQTADFWNCNNLVPIDCTGRISKDR